MPSRWIVTFSFVVSTNDEESFALYTASILLNRVNEFFTLSFCNKLSNETKNSSNFWVDLDLASISASRSYHLISPYNISPLRLGKRTKTGRPSYSNDGILSSKSIINLEKSASLK